MKRLIPLTVFFFTLLFFSSLDSKATHLMGADISYECIAPGQYKVRLQLYRDCNGVDIGTSQTLAYSSAQCGVTSSITLTQTSVRDITPVCQQNASQTSCASGGQYGVEKHVYEGTLNLPIGCGTDWILGWGVCCRNNAITNLTSPGNEDMFIQTCGLNNTLSPCNNSPVFLNDPVPFFCVSQPVNYNHGVVDADGDSIVFTSVSPQNAGGNVGYSGGLSASNPFRVTAGGPFSVNPQNGDINFTPSQIQIAVMAMRVDEYRNGVLIGCVVRDMQFTIINCSNNLPTASGINGGNTFSLTIPACSDTCFNITSADADAADVVTMSWNSGITGATFNTTTGNRPTGRFCWSTSATDVGNHFFTVQVRDDHCPIIGSNTYSYNIRVVPSNDPPVNAGPDVILCPGVSTTLNATVVGGNVLRYRWSDGTNFFNTQSISVNPVSTTLYTVTAYYASGCQKTDNVLVTRIQRPNISVFPTSITLCSGGSVNLLAASTTPNVTYHWTPTTNLSCTSCSNPVATPTSATQYCVYVTDANNCPSDTVCSQINTAAPPPPQSCAVIYATVNGTGNGSVSSPTSLQGAINMAQCNNSIIKLGTGTYTLSNPISNITSYTTIEGGFDPVTWAKTSAPGATTIFRDANNPEGNPGTQRIVAFYLNSQAYFRFHDITFQTADCPNSTFQGGMSNYIFHLTSCNNYNFVRCIMRPGRGGNGDNGVVVGTAGLDGSPGTNGTDGDDDNDNFNAPGGTGGAGAGTVGGAGSTGGTNGAAGTDGGSSTSFSAGGGGGGGGSGGQAANGGRGGNGGGINGGTAGGGGNGGSNGDPGGAGSNGLGTNGNTGAVGAVGPAGTFVGGFFVPGTQGAFGQDGEGGSGGGGGGGGGGHTCFFCANGTGNGGGGGGGGGSGGTGGEGGWGGGATIGVYMYNNGAGGNFDDCEIFLGTAGLGGTGALGGPGGLGAAGGIGAAAGLSEIGRGGNGGTGGNGGQGGPGGPGFIGSAGLVYVDGGTQPVTDLTFNLSAQPVITASNTNCTFRNITFTAGASGNWDYGAVASPQTATGANVVTQYTTFGRKNITYNSNVYTGFVNIPIDNSSYIPNIGTTATQFAPDSFQLCQGSIANFNAIIPAADTFDWNFGGATVPNTYTGPASTTQNLNNLTFNTPGTFMIRVRISTSCCGYSPYDTVYLVVEPNPTLAFSGLFALCPGDSTTITASGSSQYNWSPPTGLNTTTGATVVATPPTTTTYFVRGSSPLGLCTVDSIVTIRVTAPPTLAFVNTPATCGDNGTATANPSPAGSYSYIWNDAGNQATQTATGLTVGAYAVTVTDVTSNCSASGGTAVGAGGGLQAYIDSSRNVTCNGLCNGVARVIGIGGSTNYTYLWGNGNSTRTISGLCVGNYSVTVSDGNCTASATVSIAEPLPLVVEVFDSIDATCFTSPDGAVDANASGGTGPYIYLWNDPAQQDSAHAVNLLPGTYTILVTDQLGCTATNSVTINSPPPTSFLTNVVTDVNCFGGNDGAIDLTINGTTGPYTISWNTPNNDTTEDVSGLPFGYYTAIVIDTNNCRASGGDSIFVNQPPQLVIDTNVTDVSCFAAADACIGLTISGGVPAYVINWSNSSTANPLCNLSGGNYGVTVSDSHNCSVSISSIIVNEPTALQLAPVVTNVSCPGFNDGSIAVNASGGTPAYTYSWNSGSGAVNSNLFPGFYSVTVTDINGCTVDSSGTVLQLPGIEISGIATNVLCYPLENGTIDLSVVTLNPPASFAWSNGETTEDVSSLPVGNYSVTITDANNCTVDTAFIILNDSIFSIEAFPVDTTINLGQQVQLTVVPDGAVIGTTSWYPYEGLECSDCQNPFTKPRYTTTYDVTVTSVEGCLAWDSVRVTVIPRYDIFVPNVFTPNGDGTNDFFEVFGNKESWKQFEVQIFDRIGEKVYESTDMNFKWDGMYRGKALNPAVFVYVIQLVFIDNHADGNYKGSVTLVR